jgi:hypothetical protein
MGYQRVDVEIFQPWGVAGLIARPAARRTPSAPTAPAAEQNLLNENINRPIGFQRSPDCLVHLQIEDFLAFEIQVLVVENPAAPKESQKNSSECDPKVFIVTNP